MRAALLHALGAVPEVGDAPDPVPEAGETLVRVAAAAVGHLDRTVASGRFATTPPLPHVPGVEGAGHVVASATLPEGTAVRVRGGGVGTARAGTCAQLVAVPDDAVHPLPDGLDLTLAACAFSPAASAWLALHDVGGLRAGERVAVTGAAGAVGSLAVQLAVDGGAADVVGVVSREERIAAVPALPGVRPVVGGLPGPVDLLVDTVGGPALAERLRRVVPGGRVVLVGYTAGAVVDLDLTAVVVGDVRLLPLNLVRRAADGARAAESLLVRLAAGELHLAVERSDLSQIGVAWERLSSGAAVGRVVVEP